MRLPLKMAPLLPQSQWTASIALSVVECIDYLAYGTIFKCATFRPKIKLDVWALGGGGHFGVLFPITKLAFGGNHGVKEWKNARNHEKRNSWCTLSKSGCGINQCTHEKLFSQLQNLLLHEILLRTNMPSSTSLLFLFERKCHGNHRRRRSWPLLPPLG